MTSVNPLPPPIPSRPFPHEVIDVDSLADEDILITAHRRSHPRPPNTIGTPSSAASGNNREVIVIDSDDEDSIGPPRRPAVPRHHRLISPPPPPIHPAYVPPMPPLPQNLAGYRPPTRLPPIVHANPEPFPFEAHMNQPPRRAYTPPVLPPRGAAPSHHRPVMGLGGAIITQNRRNLHEAHRGRGHTHNHQHDPTAMPFLRGRSYFQEALRSLDRQQLGNHNLEIGFEFDDHSILEGIGDDIAFASWFDPADELLFGLHKRPTREQTTWKPSYTHPDGPVGGFTFHFDVDESPTQGSASNPSVIVLDDSGEAIEQSTQSPMSKATLACARCLCTLYQDAQETREEKRRERRVWALRCGHMLDGKCIDAIMRPAPLPVVEKMVEDRKGKGKARAGSVADEGAEHGEDAGTLTSSSAKGKGKATATEEDQSDAFDNQGLPTPQMGDNPIRSRLRPRNPPPGTGNTQMGFPARAPSPSRPTRPLPRRRPGGRGKGSRKPVVEETFDWNCPVQGCGTLHRSIRMTGEEEWKMDDEKGAIALFV